ncbi:MAG: dephospho-CoA kinase [bacterium]|nr:dephospho-CoA kinase [bacterium]
MNKCIFGVTGGIGTGKSHCLKAMEEIFRRLDIPFHCIEVDKTRRHILRVSNEETHKKARQLLAEALDLNSESPDFFIDLLDLGSKVFADEEKMIIFKETINPFIKKEIIRQNDSEGVTAVEWAMLVEDGFLPLVKGNILILTCANDVQLGRLKRSQDMSDDQLLQRVDFYRSLDKKRLEIAQNQGKMVKVFDTTKDPGRDSYECLVQEIIEKIGYKNGKNIYKK